MSRFFLLVLRSNDTPKEISKADHFFVRSCCAIAAPLLSTPAVVARNLGKLHEVPNHFFWRNGSVK